MASQQQKPMNMNPTQRSVSLVSSYLFFDMLSFKKFHQISFLIPDTILLEKGMIKQWLFNSEKQQNKILKKKRQNNTPLNVVKSLCFKSGYNFSHFKTFAQLKTQFFSIRKQQSRKQPLLLKSIQDKNVIEIITIDDEILSMPLSEFIYLVGQNKYNEHNFYQKWKIIRQKVNNQSRIQECYEVISFRKNHVIESKCHKVISLKTPDITPVSSIELSIDPYKDVAPKTETLAYQTKNLQGYKFFDTFLNKKFFSIVQELIEFIEKNYKCIVEQIRTKFVINKNRQPHFVGIYGLKIKPVKKLFNQQQFEQSSQKGFIKIQSYMKSLGYYLLNIEKDVKNNNMALAMNIAKKTKCHGQFCKVKLNKANASRQATEIMSVRSRNFNLDPSIVPSFKKLVSKQIINAVKKRKLRVLQKLKQQNIIDFNLDEKLEDESDYDESDDEVVKHVKVCQNCYSIYSHIQKIFQIDFRSGNLIEKKQSILNDQTLRIRSQSQKSFLPLLKRFELEKPILDGKMPLDNMSPINRDNPLKGQQKIQFKQSDSYQKHKSLSQRAKSHSKLQNQPEKFSPSAIKKVQDLKKVKLDPISSVTNTGHTTKGNRLLALAKSTQGAQILKQKVNFKKEKENNNKAKITKAKNFEEAENNLFSKLSILPSSSQQQFVYFSMKYAKDNLPQQLDRKCFSSQYLPSLYQFMLNSELNLAHKNWIRKRPQISLKRLSELTDYPQIVSKSAFHFNTIITDEKTTIPFCVITTKMINGNNAVNIPYQNIIICQDIFDSFIEYIPLVKDFLDSAVNKRVILFNYPGQSHTIYNNENPFNLPQFTFILDKLLYRLSTEREQLGFINLQKDKFKFLGFGFGGYLLTSYLANNYQNFIQENLTGILLVNTYKNITPTLKQKCQALKILYQSNDQVAVSEAYLFYNKAILSSETNKEDLQYKAGLNPIRNQGRVYLLKSILDLSNFENNQHNTMVQNLQNVHCPVHIIYGASNVLFSKVHASRFLKYEDTKLQKIDIGERKLIQIQGGHDLLADNYEDLQKCIEDIVML